MLSFLLSLIKVLFSFASFLLYFRKLFICKSYPVYGLIGDRFIGLHVFQVHLTNNAYLEFLEHHLPRLLGSLFFNNLFRFLCEIILYKSRTDIFLDWNKSFLGIYFLRWISIWFTEDVNPYMILFPLNLSCFILLFSS